MRFKNTAFMAIWITIALFITSAGSGFGNNIESDRVKESNQSKKGENIQLFISTVSVVVALLGFAFTLYQKIKLDKRQYALEMMREYNRQTANDRMEIERNLPGIVENCEKRLLSNKIIKKMLKQNKISKDPNNRIDYRSLRESIIRLLNYFEFVSTAYLNRAADRKIIRESFTGMMLRYYCILGTYIKETIEQIKRNPWEPYTRFVYKVVQKKEIPVSLEPCLKINKKGSFKCGRRCIDLNDLPIPMSTRRKCENQRKEPISL